MYCAAKIEELFSAYPSEDRLGAMIADGKFAKVPDENGKEIVVGCIYEGGKVKYAAYAVEGGFSREQPKELKGLASFVPLSFFETSRGFWLVLADPVTGEPVYSVKNGDTEKE